jgi:hypothetical protein
MSLVEHRRLEIERWWPHLTIEARHLVLRDLDAELEASVVVEIVEIAERDGFADASIPTRLDPRERDYVLTQIEAVD